MFNDASDFNRIFIACGYTDLRYGIDGLAAAIKNDFHIAPMNKEISFSSVAGVPTASRPYSTRVAGLSLSISA